MTVTPDRPSSSLRSEGPLPGAPKAVWLDIISRASTIRERLDLGFAPSSDTPSDVVEIRLKRWRKVVASEEDVGRFALRLSLDDLAEHQLPGVIGDGRLPADYQPPSWARTLSAVVAEASRLTADDAATIVRERTSGEERLPFEEICAPFLHVAWVRVEQRAAEALTRLSPAARAALGRSLLAQLAALGDRALFLEFHVDRSVRQPAWVTRAQQATSGASTSLYRAFVTDLLAGGLIDLFREWSVLGRIMATATDLWVDGITEFLDRLHADWTDIERTLGRGRSLGAVTAIEAALSDRHHGGRTVCAVTFASGVRVVYKPKNLGAEVCFNALLAWLNASGAPLPLKTITILNRGTHGWAEFVPNLPCDDAAAAERYYVRIGMLLCLVYALRGTDCHYENLIACGEHPVLVDPEMLLQPLDVDLGELSESEGIDAIAYRQLSETVIGTLFLPVWQFGPNGSRIDVGGVGHDPLHARLPPRLGFEHVNTDSMRQALLPRALDIATKAPHRDGRLLPARDYGDQIVEGFRSMYDCLIEQRGALLSSTGPLTAFKTTAIRYVMRATFIYAGLLARLRAPEVLRDAVDASIEGEVLCQRFLPSPVWRRFWPIMREEFDALQRLDIPYFETQADATSLTLPSGRTLEGCFAQSGYDRAAASLGRLNEADREHQVYFVRGAMLAHGMTSAHAAHAPAAAADTGEASSALGRDELVGEAIRIAGGLAGRAIRRPDRGTTWIAFTYHPAARRFRIQPIGYDLFDGTSGVALFLAALECVTGGAGFRDLALGALAPLRQDIRSRAIDRIVDNVEWGGPLSCGTIIYALTRSSRLLNDPELLDDAAVLARAITPERIAADRHLDVLFGAASVILGLLALHDATGDPGALDLAVACGRHLVQRSVLRENGCRTWPMTDGQTLTGFSHGTAGAAYALLRLHAAHPASEFLDAALGAMAFERTVFVATLGNWPDYRKPQSDGPVCGVSWCHGAPGIGLARLGGLAGHDDVATRAEIEVALETTTRLGVQAIDGLCCGNLGRAELLLAAGTRLGRPELVDRASSLLARVVRRSRTAGGYDFLGENIPRAPGGYPGFFQGEPGVGYTLLRHADPMRLPSILMFE